MTRVNWDEVELDSFGLGFGELRYARMLMSIREDVVEATSSIVPEKIHSDARNFSLVTSSSQVRSPLYLKSLDADGEDNSTVEKQITHSKKVADTELDRSLECLKENENDVKTNGEVELSAVEDALIQVVPEVSENQNPRKIGPYDFDQHANFLNS